MTRWKLIYIHVSLSWVYNARPGKFFLGRYILSYYYTFLSNTYVLYPHTLQRPVSVTRIRCLRLVILAVAIKRYGAQYPTQLLLYCRRTLYYYISLSLVEICEHTHACTHPHTRAVSDHLAEQRFFLSSSLLELAIDQMAILTV